jgi:hypothetical protein
LYTAEPLRPVLEMNRGLEINCDYGTTLEINSEARKQNRIEGASLQLKVFLIFYDDFSIAPRASDQTKDLSKYYF